MLGLLEVKVAQAACGDAHCAALTEAGALYVWGAAMGEPRNGRPADCAVPRQVFTAQVQR